jgi:hypothetical protein
MISEYQKSLDSVSFLNLEYCTGHIKEYVELSVNGYYVGHVTPVLKSGYQAAIQAFNDEKEQELGSDTLLSPQMYTLMASKTYPGVDDYNMTEEMHFSEYMRGFIGGWTACVFGIVNEYTIKTTVLQVPECPSENDNWSY